MHLQCIFNDVVQNKSTADENAKQYKCCSLLLISTLKCPASIIPRKCYEMTH